MFVWRNKQNYHLIIMKWPPYLFYCHAYSNDAKLSDKQVSANSVDQDQTAPEFAILGTSLIRV